MHIYSVTDPEFRSYGSVLEGYDTDELLAAMEKIALPEEGTAYRPGIDSLEECAIFDELRDRAYGGMPIQLGMCWGRNTKLNCLEYHRDSEVNIGTSDFILLLARRDEIEGGMLETNKVKAFRVPAGKAAVLKMRPVVYGSFFLFRVKAAVLQTGRQQEGLPGGQYILPAVYGYAKAALLYNNQHVSVQQALRMDPARASNGLSRRNKTRREMHSRKDTAHIQPPVSAARKILPIYIISGRRFCKCFYQNLVIND